jgi:hypothetical protein
VVASARPAASGIFSLREENLVHLVGNLKRKENKMCIGRTLKFVVGALVCALLGGQGPVQADLILPWSGSCNTGAPAFEVVNYGAGRALSTYTYGTQAIRGESFGTAGSGVGGIASALTGNTYGVYGKATSSPNGTGVYGLGASVGVRAESPSGTALQVLGTATFSADLWLTPNHSIKCDGPMGIGGANLDLYLGDSTADKVRVLGNMYLGYSEVSHWINFYEDGVENGEWFMWDDPADQFFLSDDLAIDGDLTVSGLDLTFSATTDWSARIRNAWDIRMEKDVDDDDTNAWFRWFTNAGAIEQMRIPDDDEADILGDGTFVNNGIDFAEAFKIVEQDLAPGDVVSLTVGNWEYCGRAAKAYDRHVLGVVSTKPGFLCGMSFNAEDAADPQIAKLRDEARARGDNEQEKQLTLQLSEIVKQTHRPIALLGRVPCNVIGPVRAGDFLTTSPTPGHAMTMTQAGPSLGIALEDSPGPGAKKIIVFVQPAWRDPGTSPTGQAAAAESPALQTQLETQEQRLSQLEAENAALRARLADVEALVAKLAGTLEP